MSDEPELLCEGSICWRVLVRRAARCSSSDWDPSAFERRSDPIRLCRKRPFAIHGQGCRPARVAVCHIPCLIL